MNILEDIIPKGWLPYYDNESNAFQITVRYSRETGKVLLGKFNHDQGWGQTTTFYKKVVSQPEFYEMPKARLESRAKCAPGEGQVIWGDPTGLSPYEEYLGGLGSIQGSTEEEWANKRQGLIDFLKAHPRYKDQEIINAILIEKNIKNGVFNSEESFHFFAGHRFM